MSSLFIGLLFGLTGILFVGGFVLLLYWLLFVEWPRQRAFKKLLAKEGFTKILQPKSINEEPFLASPIHGPREHVYKAWEKDSSLGRIRVLYLQSGSANSTSTKVLLEVKVKPVVDDFLVMPGPIPKWMAKVMARVGHVNRIELPSDLAYRYEVFAAERTDVFVAPPFELPAGLLEYLKDQVGLRFSVTSSSLLVERRVLARDTMVLDDICDPESFATAMSDLEALVPLVSGQKGKGLERLRTTHHTASENPDTGRAPLVFVTLFCLAGSLLAAVVAYFLLVRPTAQVLDARDWREVPCVVVSSGVGSSGGGESSGYSVLVSYEYEVEGKRYQSSRYGFFPFSSSGLSRAREIVHGLPPGKKTVCYIRDGNPNEAVINRGLSSELWWGLIPLVLLLFVSPGVYGLIVRSYLKLMGRPCENLDVTKFRGAELGREINRHLLGALVGCCLVVIGIVFVLFVIAWCDVHY